jgi:hypothetical protein
MNMALEKVLLPEYSTNRLKVYTVNPTKVTLGNIKFTNAGHHLVYPEIPKGQVWISNQLNHIERLYYIYHELLEHSKMLMGLNYDSAHVMANKAEGRLRHTGDMTEVNRLIKRMMDLNKDIIGEASHCNGVMKLHADGAAHHQHLNTRHHTEGIHKNRKHSNSGLVTVR